MTVESLWTMRAKRSIAKCVLHTDPAVTELLVMLDEDIALRQACPDDTAARIRAGALHDRLLAKGWRETG